VANVIEWAGVLKIGRRGLMWNDIVPKCSVQFAADSIPALGNFIGAGVLESVMGTGHWQVPLSSSAATTAAGNGNMDATAVEVNGRLHLFSKKFWPAPMGAGRLNHVP
jgi:hypothetical protein